MSGKLITHGTMPTTENPRAPYVIYQAIRDAKRYTIQKKGSASYLLIVRGHCPVLPTKEINLTTLLYKPGSKEWTREVDHEIDVWLEQNPDALIADYRYASAYQHLQLAA